MKALWIYQYNLTDGSVLEADVVLARTRPYMQIQVDLYSIGDVQHIASESFRQMEPAMLYLQRAAERVAEHVITVAPKEPVPVSLRRYEPDEALLMFDTARRHVELWFEAAKPLGLQMEPEAEWSAISAALGAVSETELRRGGTEELREGHRLLCLIAERLVDILLWELRQRRTVMLDPSVRMRRTYTRSVNSVVACLEALKHIAPLYGDVKPPVIAPVVDLFAWKQARRVTG